MDNFEIPNADELQKSPESEFASDFFQKISHYMNEFDNSLDQEHEMGIKLVNFGQSIQFAIHNLGYYNPKLICFYGTLPDGSSVQLVQHVNQISFLLTTLPRKNPEQPKQPIGFHPGLYRHQEGYPAYPSLG